MLGTKGKKESYKFFYVSTHSNVDICEEMIVLEHAWGGVRSDEGGDDYGAC